MTKIKKNHYISQQLLFHYLFLQKWMPSPWYGTPLILFVWNLLHVSWSRKRIPPVVSSFFPPDNVYSSQKNNNNNKTSKSSVMLYINLWHETNMQTHSHMHVNNTSMHISQSRKFYLMVEIKVTRLIFFQYRYAAHSNMEMHANSHKCQQLVFFKI